MIAELSVWPARNVADPKTRLEATALIEAMYARFFAATLKEHVVTVLCPRCWKRNMPQNSGCDNIFQKSVQPPPRRRFGAVISIQLATILSGYEDRNAFMRQHFGPDMFGSHFLGHATAYF
jgi:hypothetical protein